MGKNSAIPNSLTGSLYVVATPIGNLQDISERAITTLQSVDAILAEDTRHSRILLNNLGIHKPLIALHAHNEQDKLDNLISAMQNGQTYALISDAGTPLIRDPGFLLVEKAQQQKIKVIPVPGACALIAALSAAGIACDVFTFAGFLPVKSEARLARLNWFRSLYHTIVFYESTHRIQDCLHDIAKIYSSDYILVLAKELTKIHEQFIRGSVQEIQTWLTADSNRIKGEFVILLPGVIENKNQNKDVAHDQKLLSVLLQELSLKQAVKIATQLSNTPKNELYDLALQLSKQK